MPTPYDRLRGLLMDTSPHGYCYVCLTAKLSVPEAGIRDAAQVLALQRPFRLVEALCSTCGKTDRVLTYQP